MARTSAPKEVKAPKAPKEVKAPEIKAPEASKMEKTGLHIWEKVIGKYHTKDRKVIAVGQIFIAGKDTFAKDVTWKYIGPVE